MAGRIAVWTPETIAVAKECLAASSTTQEALRKFNARMGMSISRGAFNSVFRDKDLGAPSAYLARGKASEIGRSQAARIRGVDRRSVFDSDRAQASEEPVTASGPDTEPPPARATPVPEATRDAPTVDDLVGLAQKFKKRGGLTLQLAADTLDLSPMKTVALFQQAQREGRTIDFAGNEIVWRAPESPRTIAEVAPPTPGEDRIIGVFSDMHSGSKYHLGAELGTFVQRAYAVGVRDFFCPGDLLEGRYKHARWELNTHSWEEQADGILAAIPMLKGMRVFFIDGNHDWTWTEANGSESGRQLVAMAKSQGRHDLHFLGSRGALVNYGGSRVELWHPKKGAAYALSYQLQNKIRDTAIDRLPDILLTGHTHQYVKLRRQNVWAFYCGTFQHGDGPYGRSLGGDTAMGGLIIRWRKDPDGVVRRLSDEFHAIDRARQLHQVEVR